MKSRKVTIWQCEKCGFESEDQVSVGFCEAQPVSEKPDLLPGQWILLDARGYGEGNRYVRVRLHHLEVGPIADVAGILSGDMKYPSHAWVAWLSHDVRLDRYGDIRASWWPRHDVEVSHMISEADIDETWQEIKPDATIAWDDVPTCGKCNGTGKQEAPRGFYPEDCNGCEGTGRLWDQWDGKSD
jgi:hypothetical protein